MTLDEIKAYVSENGNDDSLVFENPNYESAFIGVSSCGKAIYDHELMIEYLVTNEKMNYEEAADFVSYSTLRSLGYYENSPIVLMRKYD